MKKESSGRLPASAWLPTSVKEVEARGWDAVDVILVTGDAYVDHPSFGAAVIGRLLEAEGLRVAVIPQPNWRDDLRDFRKLGAPRMFFGVTAGSMDSMVNHYTAARRLRSDDAYTAGGKAGFRPDRAATVYARILKQLYPHVPVVLGGIEASLRRLTHYDYWDDGLRPSILVESGADVVSYGMGEEAVVDIARALRNGFNMKLLRVLPQVAFVAPAEYVDRLDPERVVMLHSLEECRADGRRLAENFVRIETESNLLRPDHIIVEPLRRHQLPLGGGERVAGQLEGVENESFVIVNPPYPLMSGEVLDRAAELPYTRLPHPRYDKKGDIPAWTMIQNSVNIHRGCFGGCSFCTISAHQGKFIVSRSEDSVVREVERVARMPYFRGYISDLGGPSANMYGMAGRDEARCAACRRPSCAWPAVCANLDTSHERLLALYRRVRTVGGVKKAFVGSGIRYDLFQNQESGGAKTDARRRSPELSVSSARKSGGKEGASVGGSVTQYDSSPPHPPRGGDDEFLQNSGYLREVILHHTSGRLKVAPEHTEEHVLRLMRKPPWATFERLHDDFQRVCDAEGLRTQLIPYFISSHPGCTEADMRSLAAKTRKLHLQTDQVQDFTPTPMTLSSVMFHTGADPYTGKKVFVERNKGAKKRQKGYFH